MSTEKMDDQQRARELLPCPFCGSADSEMQQAQAEHYVQCLECEASTSLLSSRREARELWNRRAALRAAPEARQLDEWHEDHGPVVWWALDSERNSWMGEPAWIGGPGDSDWPGYHTHWTPHPAFPAARPQGVKDV